MATKLWRLVTKDIKLINVPLTRHGSKRTLGKPPEESKNLQQLLNELNYVDPKIHYKVNIGLPQLQRSRREILKKRLEHVKATRHDSTLEKLARENKLTISLDDVNDEWLKESASFHIKEVAEHYGIFEHLFGDAYFYPQVMLDIYFKRGDKLVPVYRGNDVKPSEAQTPPIVNYKAEPDTLWSLLLTNPDGHLTENGAEYVHWFVGNIPGGDVSKGEVIVDYLQPIPPRGTGFHRYIFILYKQDEKLDYSSLKKDAPCLALNERTFHTYDFYKARQDKITPAGLAFFQTDWDYTLTNFYHDVLKMDEPVYEYDFPEPYHPLQKWFPLRQPFNLYLDRYRDPKQINKEYILKKLKSRHPFMKPKPPLPFPNAVPFADKNLPHWLKLEIRKERLGFGRVQDY